MGVAAALRDLQQHPCPTVLVCLITLRPLPDPRSSIDPGHRRHAELRLGRPQRCHVGDDPGDARERRAPQAETGGTSGRSGSFGGKDSVEKIFNLLI